MQYHKKSLNFSGAAYFLYQGCTYLEPFHTVLLTENQALKCLKACGGAFIIKAAIFTQPSNLETTGATGL